VFAENDNGQPYRQSSRNERGLKEGKGGKTGKLAVDACSAPADPFHGANGNALCDGEKAYQGIDIWITASARRRLACTRQKASVPATRSLPPKLLSNNLS
jgi:hypothetical protein